MPIVSRAIVFELLLLLDHQLCQLLPLFVGFMQLSTCALEFSLCMLQARLHFSNLLSLESLNLLVYHLPFFSRNLNCLLSLVPLLLDCYLQGLQLVLKLAPFLISLSLLSKLLL